jgi:hypothetical protein
MGFDELVWKAQHDSPALEDENPRAAMAPELLGERLTEGMTRDEVRRLLGPPEHEDELTDVYELGRSTYGVSYEQIAVEYDGGELVRAQLRRT